MNVTTESGTYLEPLRAAGTAAPLFLVHAMGGTPRCYRPLSSYLLDRPVHGLRAARPRDPDYPLNSVQTMAAAYARSVKSCQPEGMIHLAGWSMGGLIVFEMARQLRTEGCNVGMIGMIDTWMRREHLWPRRSSGHQRVLDMRRWRIFYKLVTGSIGVLEDDAHPFWNCNEAARLDFVAAAGREFKPDRYSGREGDQRFREDYDAYMLLRRASDEYRPSFQECRITFITAEEERDLESAEIWNELAGGNVDVMTCPGSHLTIVSDQNASHLAEALARAMAAREGCGSRM